MAFSTQREVSDGTLVDVRLQIEFIDREDINVFINDVPQIVGTDWDWVSDTLFQMREPVPEGLELLVQRATSLEGVLNVFGGGASFDDPTMDENFRQMLFIAQEAREGATLEEVFNDLNLHGYKITNMGAGTEPGDAINYQQYMDDALGAGNARAGAVAARNQAETFRNQTEAFANGAAASRDTATTQAGLATTARNEAVAARDTAVTSRNEAQTFRNQAEGFSTSAGNSANLAQQYAGEVAGALLPIGAIVNLLRTTAPAGFGACNGQLLSRATFPVLWQMISDGVFPSVSDAQWNSDFGNRGMFSTGDGSTTFRMPDFNGVQPGSVAVVLRGNGNRSAAVVGRIQADAFQGHDRDTGIYVSDASNYADKSLPPGTPVTGSVVPTNSGSVATHNQRTGGYLEQGLNGTPRVDVETRGTNATTLICMKMFGAAIDEGTVNVLQLAADLVALTSRVQILEGQQFVRLPVRQLSGNTAEVLNIPDWVNVVELDIVNFQVSASSNAPHLLVANAGNYNLSTYDTWHTRIGSSAIAGGAGTSDVRLWNTTLPATSRLNSSIRLARVAGGTWTVAVTGYPTALGANFKCDGTVSLGSGPNLNRLTIVASPVSTVTMTGTLQVTYRR